MQYAVRRTKVHLDNFLRLYDQIENNRIDEGFLSYLEDRNNIFPDLDYSWYRTPVPAARAV